MFIARAFIWFLIGMAVLATGIAVSGSYATGNAADNVHVSTILDGDTFMVVQQRKESIIRLYGVDCPEKEQPHGKEAKMFTASTLYGRDVKLEPVDTDKYGRTVAIVHLADGATLQERLVESGSAWVFDRFCHRPVCIQWKHKEKTASQAGRGLWHERRPTPPWQWRAGHK